MAYFSSLLIGSFLQREFSPVVQDTIEKNVLVLLISACCCRLYDIREDGIATIVKSNAYYREGSPPRKAA